MTLTNYTKEQINQTNPQIDEILSTEEGQILHLKRLLVTLKQHYEKNLHTLHIQLQAEQNQRIASKKELDKLQTLLNENQKQHEFEIKALHNQQSNLKEFLRKAQEENKALIEQLNSKENQVENNPDHSFEQMRQDYEAIKTSLQQESKALEIKYLEVLNEKIGLEHRNKDLHSQLDQQTHNLNSFKSQFDQMLEAKNISEQQCNHLQELLNDEMKTHSNGINALQNQLQEMEQDKRRLEESLNLTQEKASQFQFQIEELQKQVLIFDETLKEKKELETKYTLLKNDWNELNQHYEELCHIRARIEQQSDELNQIVKDQDRDIKEKDSFIHEQGQQLFLLREELHLIITERDVLKSSLEESEGRLKVSQQHLAKKVKESTLLAERIEEQEINLNELLQTINQQKTQLMQLQVNIDFYQKEEKRLQEQVHEALKTTEAQTAKWEEKYFKLFDKLQENENIIRELKEVEKKHLQMRNMLSNLGAFMGTPFNHSSSSSTMQNPETLETTQRYTSITPPYEEPIRLITDSQSHEEKFDVFGMCQTVEKFKQNLDHE